MDFSWSPDTSRKDFTGAHVHMYIVSTLCTADFTVLTWRVFPRV